MADEPRPSTGELLAAISTHLVQLIREDYGRGPMSAKTYVVDDLVVCVLRNSGFTSVEQTMMERGRAERVVAMRQEFHELMRGKFEELVEEITGVEVLTCLSQTSVDPDITLEVFLLAEPLKAFHSPLPVDNHLLR